MSDAMPREWRLYVEDMLAFCDKALAYTKGLDRSTFAADPMRYDATPRNLELIGEAAKKRTRTQPHSRASGNPASLR